MSPRTKRVEVASPLRVECHVHFRRGTNGRKRLRVGHVPPPVPVEPGSIPRVARLLALAHRFEGLIQDGTARDLAHVALLAHVTRARVTQIMNLLLLAPDIQEEVLDLPRTAGGREIVTERELRPIAAEPAWAEQRVLWRERLGNPHPTTQPEV